MSEVRAWIIPWYREQDWPDWCALLKFDGSHKGWLAAAEAGAKRHERAGYNVCKVVIEPRKFLDWSRQNGVVGPEARVDYATFIFHQRAND